VCPAIRAARDALSELPLTERFPSLRDVARVALGHFPSPVEHVPVEGGASDAFWVKRDDRNAPAFAGNKLRALEFLLARLAPRETLLTVGGEGSTHILTTAAWGAALGAPTEAATWPHEMGSVARRVAEELGRRCRRVLRYPSVHAAAAGVALVRQRALLTGERLRWIPFGGTSPTGMLGHVNSGLELARQVECGELPVPDEIFVPLGTGGTAAGLALGLAIAGMPSKVVAVRVGPRIGIERGRLTWLAWRAANYLTWRGVRALDAWRTIRVAVHHAAFGGAYGRPHPEAERVSGELARRIGATLDSTYSAKACFAALVDRRPRGRTLFWLTFDGRWMDASPGEALPR
jgi:D-cysteine desulfhydrase